MPLSLRFLGHATFALDLDGQQILTDPLLTQTVTFLRRHSPPVDPAWLKILDLILISHGHLDHFHIPSLKKLDKKTPCLVASGLKSKLTKLGFTRVTELKVGQSFNFRGITITATPARHLARLLPGTKPISDCIGFIIKGTKSVYFPGDTDLFPEMVKLKKLKLDLCLIPIWGWAIDDHGLHLNPLKAAQALKLIQPKMAIPYHWGTLLPLAFKPLFGRFLLHPVNLFKVASKQTTPEVKVLIVPPGQKIVL